MSGMSTVELDPGATPGPAATGRAATWGLSWSGVRTVAVLELRQRVRSTRWIVALVVWFVVVGAITLLTTGALGWVAGSGQAIVRGQFLFAAVVFLVLGLGLLVTPTLSSTAVNGDRNAGTLATLQVTLLTPAEIAVGKLLAAWASACAFLVLSLPFLVLALALGGTPVAALPRVVVVIAVLLASVCGIGLGFSALTARPAGSTVLTFLTVAGLTVFTPILFGITYPTITQTETVHVYGYPDDSFGSGRCDWVDAERPVSHTERTWWLLGINPFVVVADAAGTADGSDFTSGEPLGSIRDGVRILRAGPFAEQYECWSSDDADQARLDQQQAVSRAPVWPWGLGLNVLLGAGGLVVAVRRLRIPQRTLARGTRVA